MEVDEYVSSDEEVRCRAEVKYGETYSDGELACAGSRLVLSRDRGVLDIDLDSIEEVSFTSGSVPWEYIGWTVLFVLVGVLGWGLVPDILPGQLFGPVLVFAIIATVVAIYEAVRRWRTTLTVRTTNRSHVFRGDGLADVLDEIRNRE